MENGKETETRVKIGSLFDGDDMKQNLRLKPGDILFVPRSRL